MATLSLVSLSLCILIMFNPELSHFYLACIGREELFGWVILAQLQTLLQLNKNDVLFLVKTNCVLSFKILQPSMRWVFFSLLWTELALVLHIIKHFQLNLCLSQLQPDRFLCKARTKWRWVQRSTLAPHQVHIRHPKKIPPLIWHLIRALANGITLNMFILVPIFYWRIFKFRKTQDSIVGIPLESVIGGYNIHLQEWRKTILTR